MKIDVQSLGFPLTTELVVHTERRLSFALTRTSARILRVVVRLGDRNGPRGGVERFCRIRVVLEHAPPILIEDCGTELYAVIGRAAEHAGRKVARDIERLRDNARLPVLLRPASWPDDVHDASKK